MAFEQVRFDGRKLSRATALKGLLRSELAAAAKITPFTLSRCFAGKAVRVRTARQVAEALGLSIAKLIAAEAGDSPSQPAAQAEGVRRAV